MVTLKRITELDIEQIRGWRNSDLIQNVSINRSFITAEAQKMWYDNISEASDQIHWLITANEVGVGYAAIKNIDIQIKRKKNSIISKYSPCLKGLLIFITFEGYLI